MNCFKNSVWIGSKQKSDGSIVLEKNFELKKKIKSASLSIACAGLFVSKINGICTDTAVLKPVISDYRKRILYFTVNVENLIQFGNNALTIETAGGYYSAKEKYLGWRMCNLGNPCVNVMLEIEYCDGSISNIVSDDSWYVYNGKTTFACIYDGERRDNRIDDRKSKRHADTLSPPCLKIEKTAAPVIKVHSRNKPQKIYTVNENEKIYDFGKTCTGRLSITMCGNCGDSVTIKYAERINDDYTLDTRSNREAENTDVYTLNGEGIETFAPEFTYHGFRYASVKISNENTEIKQIFQEHIFSDAEQNGSFWCDNKKIMKIHNACILTQQNALLGVPLDCTQRDERLGWLGDAYVTSETCLYNFNMKEFYRQWIDEIALTATDTPDISFIAPWPQRHEPGSPDFSSGFLILLYNHFRHYGDASIIEKHYMTAKRYVDYLIKISDNFILPHGRYGDWKSVVKGFKRGDPESTHSMYLYADIKILIFLANIIGKTDDARYYDKIKKQAYKSLTEKWYNADTKNFDSGSQFANSFALIIGLIPEADFSRVISNITDDIEKNGNHLTCGIFGTYFLPELLRLHGKKEILTKILANEDYPGWLYMLKNSTTLTESWSADEMSLCHCMFGSIDAQMYKTLAGISIDYTSDSIVNIEPFFDNSIKSLCASVMTEKGIVSIKWEKVEDIIILEIELPQNISTRVLLPNGECFKDIHGNHSFKISCK